MSQCVLYNPPQSERVEVSGEMFITFYGEATAQHSFDIDLYARSLLGFNSAFTKIGRDLLKCQIYLEIVAEEEGSLKSKIIWYGALGLMALEGYSSFLGILDYYGVKNFPFNLFANIITQQKEHKGNFSEIKRYIESLELSEEEKEKFIKLINHNDFKESLDELTICLEKEGVEEIKISQDEQSVSIYKHERGYFKARLEDKEDREEFEDVLSVINIGRDNTWRFRGAEMKKDFSAVIEDTSFLSTISTYPVSDIWKMRFSAKILKVTITEAKKKRPNPPKYSIKELQIIPEQAELPLKSNDDK